MIATAIVDPNADIALGYSGTEIRTKDGLTIQGLVIKQNDPVMMRSMGGVTQIIPNDRIAATPRDVTHADDEPEPVEPDGAGRRGPGRVSEGVTRSAPGPKAGPGDTHGTLNVAWPLLPGRKGFMPVRSRFLFAFTLLSALFLVSVPASAQVSASFGLQGGVNFANFDFKSGAPEEFDPEFKSRPRGVFGFFAAVDFTVIGIQIDALYSQKGAKTDFRDDEDDIKIEVGVDYIEVPVMLRVNAPLGGGARIRLFGGPSFGFKVKDETTLEINGVKIEDDETEFKSYDIGVVAGGALQFGKAFVDLRYNWGTTNILKDDDSDRDRAKTRTFGLMAGFAF